MNEQTKRERLTEALATVGVFFLSSSKFDFLLGCVECTKQKPGAGWHPFYVPDIDVYEYDEESGEEVERLILTDEEKRKERLWRLRGGLRAGYWLCPNGHNAGADIPADLYAEALGLHPIEHRDALGHIFEGEEDEFRAWAESLPDDDPAFTLRVPTEAEAETVIQDFFAEHYGLDETPTDGDNGEPPEYLN